MTQYPVEHAEASLLACEDAGAPGAQRAVAPRSAAQRVSVRELRAQLGPILDRVAEGERVVVTRYGKPVAVIMPEGAATQPRYPLRGTLMWQSDDFDEPLDSFWEALS